MVLVVVNFLLSCNNVENASEITSVGTDSVPTSNSILNSKDSILYEFTRINIDSAGMINNMVYATENNFTQNKIYECAECYLRNDAALALMKINEHAKKQNLNLIIYDCYRPLPYQQLMYEIVNNPNYVAHPAKGSNHNKGCAIDIGLADENNIPLNMGTLFDDFTEKSHYSSKLITEEAKNNRKILRTLMIKNGFIPYEKEWWHFNFKNTKYEVSEIKWECL
jgi:D-alanyl-D-alanine dipeptidase